MNLLDDLSWRFYICYTKKIRSLESRHSEEHSLSYKSMKNHASNILIKHTMAAYHTLMSIQTQQQKTKHMVDVDDAGIKVELKT